MRPPRAVGVAPSGWDGRAGRKTTGGAEGRATSLGKARGRSRRGDGSEQQELNLELACEIYLRSLVFGIVSF